MFSHGTPTETSTEMITNNNGLEITSTTLDQSSEEISTSVVHSSEDTSTTTVQSSEHISKKYSPEVSSSISFQHSSRSPASINKATASSTGNNILRVFLIDLRMIFLSSFIFYLIFKK